MENSVKDEKRKYCINTTIAGSWKRTKKNAQRIGSPSSTNMMKRGTTIIKTLYTG